MAAGEADVEQAGLWMQLKAARGAAELPKHVP